MQKLTNKRFMNCPESEVKSKESHKQTNKKKQAKKNTLAQNFQNSHREGFGSMSNMFSCIQC